MDIICKKICAYANVQLSMQFLISDNTFFSFTCLVRISVVAVDIKVKERSHAAKHLQIWGKVKEKTQNLKSLHTQKHPFMTSVTGTEHEISLPK